MVDEQDAGIMNSWYENQLLHHLIFCCISYNHLFECEKWCLWCQFYPSLSSWVNPESTINHDYSGDNRRLCSEYKWQYRIMWIVGESLLEKWNISSSLALFFEWESSSLDHWNLIALLLYRNLGWVTSRASTLFCIFQCVDVGKPFLISLLIKQMRIQCSKKKLYSTGLVGIPLDAWECEKTGSIGTSWIQHCQFLSDGVLVDSPWYMQDGCVHWKQWNCRIDCQYFCMMQREQERGALGLSPVKYQAFLWCFEWLIPLLLKGVTAIHQQTTLSFFMPVCLKPCLMLFLFRNLYLLPSCITSYRAI